MASRPKISVNQNRRMFSEADKMKIFGSGVNSHISVDNHAVPLPTSYLNPGIQNFPNSNQSVVPPPLPPRVDTSRHSRYSNYNSYYSPYSRYSPSLYSPGFGSYRTPYSRYGMPHDSYNSFIQLAEESTRPAFESIESVVDIVGSISMMLESTYHAVYSSYNAILGVVDQFARLKDHLAQVLSFLALLRGLRYLCLKILYILRLRKDNPSVEAAWNKAKSASENSELSRYGDGKSPWPFFMFIGLVIGAPWLMFKLLAKSVAKKSFDIKSWQGKDGYGICVGNYDFKSARRGELSFNAGEVLHIAPKYLQGNVPRGWILASNESNEVGLIPMNYLKTRSKLPQKARRPAGAFYVPDMEPTTSRSSDIPINNNINPFADEDETNTRENGPDPVLKEEQVTNTDEEE